MQSSTRRNNPGGKDRALQANAPLDALGSVGRFVHHTAGRSRVTASLALGAALSLCWLTLGLMAIRTAHVDPRLAGPGAELMARMPDIALPKAFETFLALCLTPGAIAGPGTFVILSAMWFLMALAMMLPSAAPLIRVYCEIADTAAAKGQAAVHPLILVSGYLAAWLLAACGFALSGWTLSTAGNEDSVLAPFPPLHSAALLAVAGFYQFSTFKDVCLEKCRNPFATIFAEWSDRPPRIFWLGFKQGLWCIGCCWALMLVMFVVGIMNLFWMVLIGLVAFLEKSGHNPVLSRITGTLLLVWSLVLFVISL